MAEYITSEPAGQDPMPKKPLFSRVKDNAVHSLTTREGLLGDFDFKSLCLPQLPFGNARKFRRPSPFYALDDKLPFLVRLVVGFQHSLAMIAGLVTPPIIFSSSLSLPQHTQTYLISASLISAGLLSMVQMSRFHIFRGYYLGTGLITVVGTSFATLPVAFSIFAALYKDGTCPTTTDKTGAVVKGACPDAYGALLGTMMLCSLWEMGLSMLPPKKLKAIFPPLVTGTCVILIGASLIAESGVVNWGGGSNCHARPTTGIFQKCSTIFSPKAATWGSPQYIGLGFLSFITIVLVELFGSPFMRNASIIIGLIVGMIVAGATGYIDTSSIKTAKPITFLWVETFKLRIYSPAILPGIAVYTALALEAMSDITASSEASRVEVQGDVFDSRIQGGVLADGIAGLLSGAMTMTPMSIFAQNNGVIVLTRCANRGAGYVCAILLICYGVIGKLSGVFLAIPNPVLGGVTTFLFAQVVTSGIRVLSTIKWGRKERFVLAAELVFGLGNLLVDDFMEYLFQGVKEQGPGLTGFLSAVEIILSTPYLAAFLVGVILWNILPEDAEPGIERANETQETLEMGSTYMNEPVLYKGRHEDSVDDDIKGVAVSTRVEPAI